MFKTELEYEKFDEYLNNSSYIEYTVGVIKETMCAIDASYYLENDIKYKLSSDILEALYQNVDEDELNTYLEDIKSLAYGELENISDDLEDKLEEYLFENEYLAYDTLKEIIDTDLKENGLNSSKINLAYNFNSKAIDKDLYYQVDGYENDYSTYTIDEVIAYFINENGKEILDNYINAPSQKNRSRM
ncbi:Mbov_0392 family ICE element protein [Mycoplasma sp. VS30B]